MTLGNAFAAIDIGNTQVKILCSNQSFSFFYTEEWENDVFYLLKNKRRLFAGVSSVQPSRLRELTEKGTEYSSVVLVILEKYIRHSALSIELSAVEGIGMDRILGLYGALGRTSPPCITIDCGTAITVNVVQRDFRCLGGAILPGVATQLRALHHFTGQLPVVEPVGSLTTTGLTTKQAMLLGTVRGAFGAIKEIVERIAQEFFPGEESIPVFLTGGDAPLLQKEMERWSFCPVHVPNLVREGILNVTQTLVEQKAIQA